MNNQYNPQQYPNQYAPQQPYIDPSVKRKTIKTALDGLGDKLAELLNANPILAAIGKFSDFIAYGAMALMMLFTILSLCLGGGAVIVFSITPLIFSVLALSKKQALPLTLDLSLLAGFYLTTFIMRIVDLAELGKWHMSPSAGYVMSFIFLIIELLIIILFAFIAWTYFIATLTPKAPAAYQQPMMQQPAPQQYTAPQQYAAPQQYVAPQPAAPAQKVCPACGDINNADAVVCKQCGTRF